MDIEKVKSKTIFIGLLDDQLEKILELAEEVSFAPGQTILHANEPGDTLFVIMSGQVEIHNSGVNCGEKIASLSGGEELVRQYGGDFFGEMALLDAEPRSASVVAAGDCTLLKLDRENLGELFQEDKDIHIVILGNIARVMSHRMRNVIPRVTCSE